MNRGRRNTVIVVGAVTAAFVAFNILSMSGAFDYDVWKRENALVAPITATSVRDGIITLADGREFRPAGVTRADGVPAQDFDNALRVIVAQGVVVIRDLGDGRAFLLAEPKFYNWCGTRNMDGNPWKRWGGSYLQCPVSELLIQCAYAMTALDQSGLTERERWRLEGVVHIAGVSDSPTLIADELVAFRYDGGVTYLSDYDESLEVLWKPPPSP